MPKNRRKKNKPWNPAKQAKPKKVVVVTDPAEAARKARATRNDPSKWGTNEAALTLPSNGDVGSTDATKTKTRRVSRYDWAALLEARGAMTEPQVQAVRRLEDDIAARFRTITNGGERVDCSGGSDGVTNASLMAGERIEEALSLVGPLSKALLIRLCEPATLSGQPVNNWRGVVEKVTGEHYMHGQVALAVAAAENLRAAYQDLDNGQRRAA